MTRTAINLVTDEGLDPTGKTDSLGAWERGIAAALKQSPPLAIEYPGKDSVCIVSDTIKAPLGGKSLAFVGDGGKVKATPGWKLPPRNGGNQSGRHLFTTSDGAAVVMRDIAFDYQGALQPECVGDIIRATRIGTFDASNVHQYNPRGLTTFSTPEMPETFTLQLLHVGSAIVDNCPALALDGAPTATGIVAHFCDDVTIRNTIVAFLRGQGFGLFGSRLVRWLACWAHKNGHNFNCETGPQGFGQVLIGDPNDPAQRCISSAARTAAVCVNRNYGGGIGTGVTVHGLDSRGDARLLITAGKLNTGGPTNVPVIFTDCKVDAPELALVTVQAPGDANDVGIRNLALTHRANVPILTPRNLTAPAKWDIHES